MNLPNPLKAALWTALFSFISLFGLSALGWLAHLYTWANSGGTEQLPDITVLAYAAGSASISAVIGLVNFVVRWAQERAGVGTVPTYVPPTPE